MSKRSGIVMSTKPFMAPFKFKSQRVYRRAIRKHNSSDNQNTQQTESQIQMAGERRWLLDLDGGGTNRHRISLPLTDHSCLQFMNSNYVPRLNNAILQPWNFWLKDISQIIVRFLLDPTEFCLSILSQRFSPNRASYHLLRSMLQSATKLPRKPKIKSRNGDEDEDEEEEQEEDEEEHDGRSVHSAAAYVHDFSPSKQEFEMIDELEERQGRVGRLVEVGRRMLMDGRLAPLNFDRGMSSVLQGQITAALATDLPASNPTFRNPAGNPVKIDIVGSVINGFLDGVFDRRFQKTVFMMVTNDNRTKFTLPLPYDLSNHVISFNPITKSWTDLTPPDNNNNPDNKFDKLDKKDTDTFGFINLPQSTHTQNSATTAGVSKTATKTATFDTNHNIDLLVNRVNSLHLANTTETTPALPATPTTTTTEASASATSTTATATSTTATTATATSTTATATSTSTTATATSTTATATATTATGTAGLGGVVVGQMESKESYEGRLKVLLREEEKKNVYENPWGFREDELCEYDEASNLWMGCGKMATCMSSRVAILLAKDDATRSSFISLMKLIGLQPSGNSVGAELLSSCLEQRDLASLMILQSVWAEYDNGPEDWLNGDIDDLVEDLSHLLTPDRKPLWRFLYTSLGLDTLPQNHLIRIAYPNFDNTN